MIIELSNPDRFRVGDSILIDGDSKYVTEIHQTGLSVSENKPEFKPKRTAMKRKGLFNRPSKPVKAREEPKPISDSQREHNAFMGLYRGRPCAICGTRFWGSLNIPTVGHHILAKSTHPEYKNTHENMIPLCAEHHVPFAHGKSKEFMHWLHDNHPIQWQWVQEHDHHRKEP